MQHTDEAINRLSAMRPGDTLRLGDATVTCMDSPLCGRYRVDFDDDYRAYFTNEPDNVLYVLRVDAESAMPVFVQAQCHEFNEAARRYYGHRDAALRDGLALAASDFEATGDIYFKYALALLAEWES